MRGHQRSLQRQLTALLSIAILTSCTNIGSSGPARPGKARGPLCDGPEPVCAEVVTQGHQVLELVGATGIDSSVNTKRGSTTYTTSFVIRDFSAASVASDYRFGFELENREKDVLWKPAGSKFEDGIRVLRFRGKSDVAILDVMVRLTTLKKETVSVEATISGRPRTAGTIDRQA